MAAIRDVPRRDPAELLDVARMQPRSATASGAGGAALDAVLLHALLDQRPGRQRLGVGPPLVDVSRGLTPSVAGGGTAAILASALRRLVAKQHDSARERGMHARCDRARPRRWPESIEFV